MRTFVEMNTSREFLRSGQLTLKNGFFTLYINVILFVRNYEQDVFASNYTAYVKKISQRYKSVEKVDVTVRGKVYVKGVRNG